MEKYSELIQKIVGGLAVAVLSSGAAWTLATYNQVSDVDQRLDNTYLDILQTQQRVENNLQKIEELRREVDYIKAFEEAEDQAEAKSKAILNQ